MANESINSTHAEICEWLKKLRFKRKFIGGVDEDDVLRKMAELNALYEAALLSERERYNALLSQGGTEHGA